MLKLIIEKYAPLTILAQNRKESKTRVNSKEGQTYHSMLK
jgi:hypothetical protein